MSFTSRNANLAAIKLIQLRLISVSLTVYTKCDRNCDIIGR